MAAMRWPHSRWSPDLRWVPAPRPPAVMILLSYIQSKITSVLPFLFVQDQKQLTGYGREALVCWREGLRERTACRHPAFSIAP